jgi:hypothetical protein
MKNERLQQELDAIAEKVRARHTHTQPRAGLTKGPEGLVFDPFKGDYAEDLRKSNPRNAPVQKGPPQGSCWKSLVPGRTFGGTIGWEFWSPAYSTPFKGNFAATNGNTDTHDYWIACRWTHYR